MAIGLTLTLPISVSGAPSVRRPVSGTPVSGIPVLRTASPPPAWTATTKAPGVRDKAAGLDGRWQRALQRRRKLAARHRGSDPAAVLALTGLLAELAGDVSPKALRSLVDGIHSDRRRHPLVVAYAGYLLARLDESAGRAVEARARLTGEGALVSWQIIGPFDNAGKAGDTAVYPPETQAYSPTQSMFGKLPGEPLGWRSYDYDGIPRGGYVSFDDVLRPNEQVVAYATCWVKVEASTDAVLHLGTGGAYTAWVDGSEIGRGEAYRHAHPLQDAHALRLNKGWNRILMKVGAMDGLWGFHASLRALDGTRLKGLTSTGLPPTRRSLNAAGRSAGASGVGTGSRAVVTTRPISLRQHLERAYPGLSQDAKKPGPAARGRDLVEFYRWVHPFDRDDETPVKLARRVDDRVRSSETAALLSSHERDQAGSRQALVQGIARARTEGKGARGRLGAMLLELAWRERSLGLEYRYRELVDEAMAVAPDDAIIELALADRVAEDGYHWLGLTWIRDMIARYPESETLHHELASRLRGQGRTGEALAVLQHAAGRVGRERTLVSPRIEALLDQGKPDAAAELARRAAEAAPELPEAHVRLAHLEQARGEETAARVALAKAIALAPHDARVHAELGRLLARGGSKDAAAASLRRSLSLRPQQPDVRDLLATLSDASKDDLFTRYAVSLAKIGATKTPAAWKGKSSGIVHQRIAVHVHDNGLTDRLDHRIVRILDERGVRQQSVQAMSYDPAESYVEVRRARVRRADGSIEELGDTHTVALASAGYRMYYDQRQVQVRFSGLRVGDTLEVAFLQRDIAARNMFDEYFGDMVPLQGIEPRKRVEYVLEAPSDKPLFFNLKMSRTERDDGITVYRRVETDVPGIKPENSMPGWTEFARFLHVSTYENWDDVGRWYWDLVRGQLVVDDKIKAGVAEAIAGLPAAASLADKVGAIYAHVVRNTRYVGLEFGIHGYKPYRTTDIYSRRFGDCKDKASLLKVMLAEVGIDSHLVLVRTRDQGALPVAPASLSAFNHAIVYVPGLDLFLDGTAEWSGPTELPANDQGASVLIIEDGRGATFRSIPISAAVDNLRTTTQTVTLAPDGSAEMRQTSVIQGAAASKLRFQFQAEEARRERLAKAFGDTFPGAEVLESAAPGIGDIGQPARLDTKLRIPSWGTKERDQVRFSVLGRDSRLAASLAPTAKREHDMLLDTASVERQTIRYEIPSGYRLARLPEGKTIESPVGRFVLTVRKTAGGAEVSSDLSLTKQRISPKEYPLFRDFLRQVDETLEQSFEMVKAR
ncbi:MAG: DUF3857 domain-containing protein [Nannocystaceae bacterium]|nr:DUF3857 domain-containing protein [Nannocystaceae bacterium]